jgi:hypothetical protein
MLGLRDERLHKVTQRNQRPVPVDVRCRYTAPREVGMPHSRPLRSKRAIGMMAGALAALYIGLLSLVLFDGRPVGLVLGGCIALGALFLFQASLPRPTGWAQAILANGVLLTMFVFVVLLDAVSLHPGLAKDVQFGAASMIEYVLKLMMFVALPGAILGAILHRCLSLARSER